VYLFPIIAVKKKKKTAFSFNIKVPTKNPGKPVFGDSSRAIEGL